MKYQANVIVKENGFTRKLSYDFINLTTNLKSQLEDMFSVINEWPNVEAYIIDYTEGEEDYNPNLREVKEHISNNS